jgi:hypothetical protein
MRSKTIAKAAAGLFAVVAPLGIALGGASSASADPGLCVSGPYGFVDACVQAPGWVNWYDGPRWHDGWHDGWRHGGGDDQGEDD